MIAAYPINFSVALAILVLITYLVLRHLYRDRIEALNHMLSLYRERFGPIANEKAGPGHSKRGIESPNIPSEAAKPKLQDRRDVARQHLSENAIPTSQGVYTRDVKIVGPDKVELWIYSNESGGLSSKFLNNANAAVQNLQIDISDLRTFNASERTWRNPRHFSGRIGPITGFTEPDEFTSEGTFAIPQDQSFRLGEQVNSVLVYPSGIASDPMRRWRVALHVTGASVPERRGSILKTMPLQPWHFEVCLRQDVQSGVLDLMQYDDTIPVDRV